MADTLSPAERSALMAKIRGKDTKPEWRVRRLVHGMGYRYRLHRRDLPGTPDLVFPARRKAIFVHGCFWHWHPDPACRIAGLPKSRLEFWAPKLERNRRRDAAKLAELGALGWDALVVWECGTGRRDEPGLGAALRAFLGPAGGRRRAAPAPPGVSRPCADGG